MTYDRIGKMYVFKPRVKHESYPISSLSNYNAFTSSQKSQSLGRCTSYGDFDYFACERSHDHNGFPPSHGSTLNSFTYLWDASGKTIQSSDARLTWMFLGCTGRWLYLLQVLVWKSPANVSWPLRRITKMDVTSQPLTRLLSRLGANRCFGMQLSGQVCSNPTWHQWTNEWTMGHGSSLFNQKSGEVPRVIVLPHQAPLNWSWSKFQVPLFRFMNLWRNKQTQDGLIGWCVECPRSAQYLTSAHN
jgi:hypothetical protein